MAEIVKTFKFRLVPSRNKAEKMAQHAGASRFVWNKGIEYLEKRRADGQKHVGFMTKEVGLFVLFNQLRNGDETLWLKQLSSAIDAAIISAAKLSPLTRDSAG